jgi:microcystin-dependent protein
MTLYKWSQTSASDATADSTINWQEGQAPSTVNDSARAMMAATAKYRDDIAGAIVTGGTSTAYTVSSYQVFDTLAHLGGQTVAFTPHTTNGATVTLNVDSLGAKPLRTSPGVELLAGTIIQGTPYVVVYNNSDAVFYLQSFYGASTYLVPLGCGLDFYGSAAPNGSFALPYGQAISRTAYLSLFSIMGTTYGTGDGSTTFNIPDLRGRVRAAMDNMGGTGAGRLTAANGGLDGTTLGAAGGNAAHTLTLSELPTGITSSNTSAIALSVSSTVSNVDIGETVDQAGAGGIGNESVNGTGSLTSTGNIAIGNVAVTANNTSGGAHTIVQPTFVCNYIIRIV